MSERKEDRQQVLAAVHSSIEQRMDNGSVGVYVALARAYGEKYRIGVEDWVMDGRRVFSSVEYAWDWAQTLP
jgi:hypothetical protein